MKKLISTFAALSMAISVAGCATNPDNITAAHVSSNSYSKMSCSSIKEEFAQVNSKLLAITKEQKDARKLDTVSLTVGLVIFWPALFLLAVTDDEKEQIAQLKGQHDAVKAAALKRSCKLAS
ncbi:hypothetical protein [Polycladidibacter stylochi]|uniref:hypothetical protein n=1 Tax=Polycladidibacter stylochi TaxID=1807766 RepID=UPI00082C9822|nr:hypothetical protein [Pseudovibrio stylochi]